MNVEYYRAFLKTAEIGNITAAAVRLGYTQSGVSHIIMQLEREFGFPLFIRSKAGVRLTACGQRLLPFMREVVERDDRLHDVAREVGGMRTARLRVGAFSSAASHWLPNIIREFGLIHPEIEFEISVGTYDTIEEQLLNGEIDCGFTTGSTGKRLDFYSLREDRMLALLPENHPLAQRGALSPDDIAELDFIMPAEGSNYDIGHILSSAGIVPRIRFTVSDDYAAIALVRGGLGMTIVPELILTGIRNTGKAMELIPPQVRTIGIAVRPNSSLSPACKAFLGFVKDWVAGMQQN